MPAHQSMLDSIAGGLSAALGNNNNLQWVQTLPGGDINHAGLIRYGNTNWFVKYHTSAPNGMFGAEATALTEIADQGCIRTPRPVTHGGDGNIDAQYLRTLDDVGYVVTDVATSREAAEGLERQLRALTGTLRSRVLF